MTETEFFEKVKSFEGFRGVRYLDASGVPTIGYGFTSSIFKDGIVPETMTKERADVILEGALYSAICDVYEYMNDRGYRQMTNDTWYALTDFYYNCGKTNLVKLTRGGLRSYQEIKEKILEYNHAGGRVLPGLTKRRQWESDLIQGEIVKINHTASELQQLCNIRYGQNLKVDGIIGQKTINVIFDLLSQK